MVELVEVRFVVGDPLLDRLPRRFDGFHGLDIEWWRRRAPACIVALRGLGSRRHVTRGDGAQVAGELSACTTIMDSGTTPQGHATVLLMSAASEIAGQCKTRVAAPHAAILICAERWCSFPEVVAESLGRAGSLTDH